MVKIKKEIKFGIFEIVFSIFIISLALILRDFTFEKFLLLDFILFILKAIAYLIFLDGIFRIILKMDLGEFINYGVNLFKD